jgi:hypothetical protein
MRRTLTVSGAWCLVPGYLVPGSWVVPGLAYRTEHQAGGTHQARGTHQAPSTRHEEPGTVQCHDSASADLTMKLQSLVCTPTATLERID